MKATLPKEIRALTAAIAGFQAEVDRRHADIERAGEAFTRAEHLTRDLEALAERRAQLQAEAFIQRTQADLSQIDAEEQELESASRAARADGRSAEIAIGILNKQLAELATRIEQATEERRQLALTWLEERRERAMDAYIKALTDLGTIVAEAAAADKARSSLGDIKWRQRAGSWLLDEWGQIGLPLPVSRQIALGDPQWPRYHNPITWPRDGKSYDAEFGALQELLREAGLLDPVTTDAATTAEA